MAIPWKDPVAEYGQYDMQHIVYLLDGALSWGDEAGVYIDVQPGGIWCQGVYDGQFYPWQSGVEELFNPMCTHNTRDAYTQGRLVLFDVLGGELRVA